MTTIVTLSGTAVAASTMISRAMRLISQISPGVPPTTDEYASGLEALNSMLDSWRNEELMCIARLDEPLTYVPGQTSYTVGLGGDLNTNRPVRIDAAYLVDNGGVSYDVTILSAEEFISIGLKSSTSTLPNYLYYSPDMPLGNLWPYPVPAAAYTLHILTWTPHMSYTTTGTTAFLAPGWEEAIVYNLAIRLAPEFEKDPSSSVINIAMTSKAYIKRINSRPVKIYNELAALINNHHSNILTNA